MDLAIRNGHTVTTGSRFDADIGIADGRIVQLGGAVPSATREIDATGLLVLPGGVDVHVHVAPTRIPARDATGSGELLLRQADDFRSASQAAAAGGITTIGDFAFPMARETPLAAADRVAADLARDSLVDFVVHPVLLDASNVSLEDIQELAERGYRSLKLFMLWDGFDAQVDAYLPLIGAAGEAGMLTMLHCEDAPLIGMLRQRQIRAGAGAPANYADTRPIYTETVAVTRAVAMCEATGAPIYVVHLSSEGALDVARSARQRQLPVYIETRPIYLVFTEERYKDPDGALYVGNPPLRTQRDLEALWGGLASGGIHTCCSDHAPPPRGEKRRSDRDVRDAAPGMADLETLMPILFSEGVVDGRISIERFIEVTSTNAAKLFGLYPRKGTIAIGSDADMVIWDPDQTRIFSLGSAVSQADFTLYEGRAIQGWPRTTISHGEIVYEDGAIKETRRRGNRVEMGAFTSL